ncbi:MAG: hypothetical protein H7321_07715 [Bacteroidia bacterium]|nr:hypothetical protein [Bacteroidia bacterium]
MSGIEAYTDNNKLYKLRLGETLSLYANIELAKKRLTYLRWKAVEALDKHLFEFETSVKKTDNIIHWANNASEVVEIIEKKTSVSEKISFIESPLIKEITAGSKIKPQEHADQIVDVVVVSSKFIIANTGNIFIALDSELAYKQLTGCKKLIVIAGIDQVIASQSELGLSKMLYATFERGELQYPFEILTRPGKIKGTGCEVSIIVTDNGRSNVLAHPMHRSLFYLLNFNLPPVCAIDRISRGNESQIDSLKYFTYPYISEADKFNKHFYLNNGLKTLDSYLPYDIDMLAQVSEARKAAFEQQKKGMLEKVFAQNKTVLSLNKEKYSNFSKFKPFIESYMLGKDFNLSSPGGQTFVQKWFSDKRKI